MKSENTMNHRVFISMILWIWTGFSPAFGQLADTHAFPFQTGSGTIIQEVPSVSRKELSDELQSFQLLEENIQRGFFGYELFREAGYSPFEITVQSVLYNLDPNIFVTKKGQTDECIVVAAHYDVTGKDSKGILDNASGIIEVTNLAEAFRNVKTWFTYEFVLFGDEEIGLFGSEDFMHRLTPEQIAKIKLMINLDAIGHGPAGFCSSMSDDSLEERLIAAAARCGLSMGPCSLFPECNSDQNNFLKYGIPVVFISSTTAGKLHSYEDVFSNIHMDTIENMHHILIEFILSLESSRHANETD